jgi:hypothetical protein
LDQRGFCGVLSGKYMKGWADEPVSCLPLVLSAASVISPLCVKMLQNAHSLPERIAHAHGSGSEGPGLKYLADVPGWVHGASVEENEETIASTVHMSTDRVLGDC